MNDPTFVEASRKLAERTLNSVKESDSEKLTWIFRTTTSRTPSARELTLLQDTLTKARNHYAGNPELARQLMTVGESDLDSSLPVLEIAAYSAIANALLNADEVITKN